jgi:uncharacterized membrane protein
VNKLLKEEPKKAIFLLSIVALMWVIFLSNVMLLIGICYRSMRMISCYLFWIIFHLIGSFFLCLSYVVLCCFYDKKCMDHSEGRIGTDVGASVGIFFINILYTIVAVIVIFAVCNYKLVAE